MWGSCGMRTALCHRAWLLMGVRARACCPHVAASYRAAGSPGSLDAHGGTHPIFGALCSCSSPTLEVSFTKGPFFMSHASAEGKAQSAQVPPV